MIETLIAEKNALEEENKALKSNVDNLLLENRYLKKAVKQYLYPAVANEILKNENVLEQADTKVTQAAMGQLTDSTFPLSYSNSVATDKEMISCEEALLRRMRNQIKGE